MQNGFKSANKKLLGARFELLKIAETESCLKGNDNIIGSRIGEYIAIKYYERKGIKTKKAESTTNPGYDLTYIVDGHIRKISVKLISGENKYGMTTRLKTDWDDFILIELTKDYGISRIGIMKNENFNKIQKKIGYSEQPQVRRTMLSEKGMIKKAGGYLVSQEEINELNKIIF